MKIDRLIGIITILLRKEKVTTAELAARFEVSQRTIQRDIETIGKAGIPILSMQGYGGGIAIAEGYKLDKTVLTQKEMSAIFMGLKGIDSISPAPYSQGLMERLTKEKQTLLTYHDRVRIHLSSFYQADLTEKIDVLKQAIHSQQHLSFYYYSEKGEGARTIEPYVILFRWFAWYVYGYCLDRQAFRLFKLNRFVKLKKLDTHYEEREISEEALDFDRYMWHDEIPLVALFDTGVKYRLIDDYGPEGINVDASSGKLRFENVFTNRDYLLQWLLSYGDAVKVLEPRDVAEDICEKAKKMMANYN